MSDLRPASRWLLASWLALAGACGGDQVAEFCDEVEALDIADAAGLAVDRSDRPEVRARLVSIAEHADDVLRAAPDEIADDVAVLAGLTRALADAAIASEGRDALARAEALIDAQLPWLERMDEAVANYRAYVIHNCVAAP